MPISLSILLGGLAFLLGFLSGSAVFARVLHQREQRLARKARAVDEARIELHDYGIELATRVTDLADREHEVAKAGRRERRLWWRRLGKGGGRRG